MNRLWLVVDGGVVKVKAFGFKDFLFSVVMLAEVAACKKAMRRREEFTHGTKPQTANHQP